MRNVALLLAMVLAAASAAVPGAPGRGEERVSVVLPAGDPQAGRRAFLELSCGSCHAVAGEPDFPAPVSAHPGPTLGPVQAMQSPEQIASSILYPSAQVAEDVRLPHEDGLSHMGDWSGAMTVRQLSDLIAYIRSLTGRR